MTLFVAAAGTCGRGVFSDTAIRAGAAFERSPVLVVPEAHLAGLSQTALHDYWFAWGADETDAGFAGGFGSVYNHAAAPNATYRKRLAAVCIEFAALRDIAAG